MVVCAILHVTSSTGMFTPEPYYSYYIRVIYCATTVLTVMTEGNRKFPNLFLVLWGHHQMPLVVDQISSRKYVYTFHSFDFFRESNTLAQFTNFLEKL